MSNSTWLKEYEEEISEVKELAGRAKYLKVELGVEPYMRRLETGVVEDRITAALRGEFKEKYIEILGEEKRVLLARRLYGVGRWGADDEGPREFKENEQRVNPDFKENDLDHVEELLEWVKEVEDDYPVLREAVIEGEAENWLDFYKMIIPHDNGEIIVKDMARGHEDFHGRKGKMHKRKEAWAGRRLFDLYMSAEQAEIFKKLYSRWEKRQPEDMLVNFGHILDKVQASQNVAKHVVPFNLDRPFSKETLEGIDAPMTYFLRMGGLPKEARRELIAFAEDKFFKNWVQLEQDWVITIVDEARFKLRKLMEG